MMTVHITCSNCGSGINVLPSLDASKVECDICKNVQNVQFNQDHVDGILKDCPCCKRKDFYIQKDFNRKVGVFLFVVAAILSIWTYGISLIVLYLVDLFLFKKLKMIAICYKCLTIFRRVKNSEEISPFDHEMNDRIVYSDHDFQGKKPSH